jgi:uroporphyrinogen decarboxylase
MESPKTYVEQLLKPRVFERIAKAAQFKEPDRLPIWDYIDNWHAVEYFARGEKDLLKASVRVHHGLGIDLCRGFGASYDSGSDGRVVIEGGLERRILGQTLWINPPVKSVVDLRSYRVDSPSYQGVMEYVESNRRYCEAFAPFTMWVPGCSVGFDIYYSVTDLKVFSLAVKSIPEEVRRIMKERNDASLEYVKAIAKERLSPLFFIGEDIAYKRNLMFSPEYLKMEFIPLLERLCRPLNNVGIKVIFHSDGYLPDQIIDALIMAGVDGLNPIEPMAGMDIAHLKSKYYGKLILVGNLDCSQLLPFGSTEKVIEETRKLIEIASPGGGHFIGSSGEITPAAPLENIIAFYRTVHRYGRYPIGSRS